MTLPHTPTLTTEATILSSPKSKANDSRRPDERTTDTATRPTRTPHTPYDQQQQRRWKSSVIRKCVNFIHHDVHQVVQQSPLLSRKAVQQQQQQQESQPSASSTMVYLHRSEITTGSLLGVGGFSNVYEVVGIHLRPDVSCQLAPQVQAQRERLAKESLLLYNGQAKYALKVLQDKFTTTPRDDSTQKRDATAKHFAYAASDLVVESLYLQYLQQQEPSSNHIIQLRALPLNGIDAWGQADATVDSFFLLMDRVQCTLDTIHSTYQTVSLEQKVDYACQLAHALQYLHDRRIVFRDLKPQNVGIDAQTNRIVLLDFGLVRELPPSTSTSTSNDTVLDEVFHMSGVGTRRYMATEIVNHSKYNTKADVYSWSMVIYELLVQQRPFANYSIEDHRIRVCQGGERPKLDTVRVVERLSSSTRSHTTLPSNGNHHGSFASTTNNDSSNSTRKMPLVIANLLRSCWTESISERLSSAELVRVLQSIVQSEHYLQLLQVAEHAQQQQQPLTLSSLEMSGHSERVQPSTDLPLVSSQSTASSQSSSWSSMFSNVTASSSIMGDGTLYGSHNLLDKYNDDDDDDETSDTDHACRGDDNYDNDDDVVVKEDDHITTVTATTVITTPSRSKSYESPSRYTFAMSHHKHHNHHPTNQASSALVSMHKAASIYRKVTTPDRPNMTSPSSVCSDSPCFSYPADTIKTTLSAVSTKSLSDSDTNREDDDDDENDSTSRIYIQAVQSREEWCPETPVRETLDLIREDKDPMEGGRHESKQTTNRLTPPAPYQMGRAITA